MRSEPSDAAPGESKIPTQTKAARNAAKDRPAKRSPLAQNETNTYELGPISAPDPRSPFKLSVRMPGWFPDAADLARGPRQPLFEEEVIGRKKSGYYESLPVPFLDEDEGSKKWILGSRLIKTKEAPASEKALTAFVRELAKMMRQYNASLYRLRRLHFYWDYKDKPGQVIWPPPNPDETNPSIPDPSDLKRFTVLVNDAEQDWADINEEVSRLLEEASAGGNSYKLKLLAADMVAVNGYVVSIRVVVEPERREPGGSSSHVSISSAFSSPGPKRRASV